MQGWMFAAVAKRALSVLSLSPDHLLRMLEGLTESKLDPDSAAIFSTIIVLPHPGGPTRRKVFGGLR